MIPSDHFVRFYNEVFKFLDEQGGLPDYYEEISHEQAAAVAELVWKKGMKGLKEHFDRIFREENCTADNWTTERDRFAHMRKCPSLTKAMDNDGGLCEKYCLHCPGWGIRLWTRCGIYAVYDLMGLRNPECREFKSESREAAEEFRRKILAEGADPAMVFSNLDEGDLVESYRARRLAGEPMPPI